MTVPGSSGSWQWHRVRGEYRVPKWRLNTASMRTCCTSDSASIWPHRQRKPTRCWHNFLPVTVVQVDAEILDQPAHIPAHRAVKPPSSMPPAPVTGVIEIKFGGATVRIEGASGMRNECIGDQYETRR